MEIRQIELKGKVIDYQLNTKPIKRCYVKIVAGQVVVNSSPTFTISAIEQLLRENQDVILEKINSYVAKYNYQNGGYVYIFNKRYEIVLYDMGLKKIAIHGDKLYVYHRAIQKTIEDGLKDILNDYLVKRINEYLVNDFKLKMPQIEIKKYKSKWGSCTSLLNKVSFNLVLVHVDKELIDYVIVHELCHFLQQNHSKQFYQEVFKRMPDYQKREDKLKETGL